MTRPLTVAIAIISVLVLLDEFTLGRAFFTVIATCVASILTGLTAGANGNPVISILAAYLHLYGWAGCLKAVLVGIFAGYALGRIGDLRPS